MRLSFSKTIPGYTIVLLLLCAGHAGAGVIIAFDNPLLSGSPGDVLTFTGTVANNTGKTVFLNQGSVNIFGPFDVVVPLLSWPISVDPSSTSDDFVFFTVTIPNPFAGPDGSHGGTLLMQGGADPDALDFLNDAADASFAVDVEPPTETPEPGTFGLFAAAAACAVIRLTHSSRTSGRCD